MRRQKERQLQYRPEYCTTKGQQPQSDQPDNEAARDQAFKECTNIVVNSGVATACGPHFDGDIMVPLNICMQGEAVHCVTLSTKEHKHLITLNFQTLP